MAIVYDIEEVEFEDVNKSNDLPSRIITVTDTYQVTSLGKTISSETVDRIRDLYNEYSQAYGLSVEFDVNSLTNNFKDIINPRRKKIFEIYLSEAFSRVRLVVFQRSLVAIATLMEQVSDPLVLMDNSYPIEHKYGMIQQLMKLMNDFNTMYQDINIPDADVKLRNINNLYAESSESINIQKDPKTLEVMNELEKIILKNSEPASPTE